MKKSNEILGLPVISITEGRELGMSKTLLIDAKNRKVAAITIEDEDWYRGVKLIPYDSVIAIGNDAVTVTSSETIIKLDEAADFENLLDENIRIIGTKAITKAGTIEGSVSEIYIGEDGTIERCEVTSADGATTEVTIDQISIFGKQVTVIDSGDLPEKKNSSMTSDPVSTPVIPPTPEPVQEAVELPVVEEVKTEEIAVEIPAVEEPVADAPAVEIPAMETPQVEEVTVEESAVEVPAVEEVKAEEPAVEIPAVEPVIDAPAVDIPAVEEVKAEEPAVEIPAVEPVAEEPAVEIPAVESVVDAPAVDIPAVEEVKAEEPAVEVPAVEPVAEAPAVEMPAVEEPKVEMPKVELPKAVAPKAKPMDKAQEDRHRRFLLGKKATRKIEMDNGIVIVEAGAEITEEVLQKAKLANKFTELAMNVQ